MGKTTEGENAIYVMLLEPDGETPVGTASVPLQVKLPDWYYIGGQTVTLNGTNAAQVPNIPADATIFEIRAESGEVYFEINGITASALSPGYLPEDNGEIIGPLSNLSSLWLFSTTASTIAHIMFFREA